MPSNRQVEPTAASGLRSLAVPSSLRSSASAHLERYTAATWLDTLLRSQSSLISLQRTTHKRLSLVGGGAWIGPFTTITSTEAKLAHGTSRTLSAILLRIPTSVRREQSSFVSCDCGETLLHMKISIHRPARKR